MTASEIVNACLEDGSGSVWTQFVRRFQPIIASGVIGVARRYGPVSPALVDDLIQDTYLNLCKDRCRALREFRAHHDDAICGFVKTVAIRIALDHFRSRLSDKRRAEVPDDGAKRDVAGPSSGIERAALLNELESRLAATESERDQTIFWLYYRQGYTAKEIASLPGVEIGAKGVESCIFRLTNALRNVVNEIEKGKSSATAFGVMK